MHFWIDKRSQACGFNGRHRIPASLSSGRRRRSKPMVTPIHRLQSDSGIARRPHQHVSHSRNTNNHHACLTPVITHGSVSTPATRPPHSAELDSSVYLDAPINAIDTAQHAQLMRLGGLIKYGMWASFGLTTLSVAATKFYVDHQGTFEILVLFTLSVLSFGLLVTCALSLCRMKVKERAHAIEARAANRRAGIEVEIPEAIPHHREEVILTVNNSSPQNVVTVTTAPEIELPPPPYHIAILLPPKEIKPEEVPPPCYENAVR